MTNIIPIAVLTSPYRAKLILNVYKNWIKQNDSVLDLGCGNGLVTDYLRKNLGLNIIGCDVKNYLCVDIPFIKLSKNNKLPFQDKHFNIIMLNDVLHHLEFPHQIKVLKEAIRIGEKVLLFEMEASFISNVFDFILNKLHYDSLETPLSFRSVKEWEMLFVKLSLKYELVTIKKSLWYPFSHSAMMVWK